MKHTLKLAKASQWLDGGARSPNEQVVKRRLREMLCLIGSSECDHCSDTMKFSERIGFVRRTLQKESMDDALKNALWNIVHEFFWSDCYLSMGNLELPGNAYLLRKLWAEHFFQPIPKLPKTIFYAYQAVNKAYDASTWASVCDFVEFVANEPMPHESRRLFIDRCNAVLSQHMSAYRFVGTTLTPITSEEEITAVEQAMTHGDAFKPVVAHIETALARLADRSSPDYRNSIKESVSAVEAACQVVTGDAKVTLGQTLKKIGVHPALERGFSAIYGYASDADGIRHALLDKPTVDADDAKFFLVSCSAFVNYLIAKSSGRVAAGTPP